MHKRFIITLAAVAILAEIAVAQPAVKKSTTQKPAQKEKTAKVNTNEPTAVTGPGTTTKDGLKYWDIKPGAGETATDGKTVKVHYTGWLTNGKKFDSSVDRGQPFE